MPFWAALDSFAEAHGALPWDVLADLQHKPGALDMFRWLGKWHSTVEQLRPRK